MLRDECIDVAPTWAVETTNDCHREIDRQLRSIAKRRAGLDVEEARWLREAERLRIWRRLGFSTALEYLEDVFGYSPRTAMERLRVARELGELRGLEAKLREGRLSYSAAKELSRVMTPATEAAWLARSRGKNLRDIEELVAGRKKGDAPDAPQDPALLTRKLSLKLPPRVDALLQQCRGVAEDEMGRHIEDVDLLELLCRRFLEAPAANGKRKRPAHRIVIHKCDECQRGWQEARGRRVLLDANDLARAQRDAEVIDDRKRIDADVIDEGTQIHDADVIDDRKRNAEVINDLIRARVAETTPYPEKTTSSIPAAVRRSVWARDRGRCRVPGCRATRNLDIHHLKHRAHGGDHHPSNLLVLCSGHHKLLHDGLLSITGLAPDRLTFVRDGRRLIDDRATHSMPTDHAASKDASSRRRVSASSKRRDIDDAGTMSKCRDIDDAGAMSKRRDIDAKRTRFDDVVLLEQAKQALVELGYSRRAARQAVIDARAGAPEADVPTLVRMVLARGRAAELIDSAEDPCKLAKQALVQMGYSAAIATRAVRAASAHVGGADLQSLIKAALQRCN